MQQVRHLIAQAARTTVNVLISGETGTGKGLVASIIHTSSERKSGPFQKVLCHVLPEPLFESELFGHEAGAFTDARQLKKGLFELAAGGTLFLDEVADIPISVQAKLLQALEDFTFRRLGGTQVIRMEARLICATNQNLQSLVEAGRFRRDLFYRLNVLSIELPPLREQVEDIPLLVEHYLDYYEKCHHYPIKSICKEALESLVGYSWPGNVRELQNVIQNCLICAEGDMLTPEHLPRAVVEASRPPPLIAEMLVEQERLRRVLAQNGNNLAKTARQLGLTRQSLYRRLEKYGIQR